MNQSLNKSTLKEKIMQYDFAIDDLVLYLDTHPKDTDALETYSKLRDKYLILVGEYFHRFGPLNFNQVTSDNYWTWISEDWPWEGGCE